MHVGTSLFHHPAAFCTLLYLLSSHLLVCFAPGFFCTLHRKDLACHTCCMSCHMLGIAWTGASFCNTCIYRLGSIVRSPSGTICNFFSPFFFSFLNLPNSLSSLILSRLVSLSLGFYSFDHNSTCSLLPSLVSFITNDNFFNQAFIIYAVNDLCF